MTDTLHGERLLYGALNCPVQAAIPLSARIVAIADVYDALRARRLYKPSLSHAAAMQLVSEGAGKQFDPVLMQALQKCAGGFERIFRELPD